MQVDAAWVLAAAVGLGSFIAWLAKAYIQTLKDDIAAERAEKQQWQAMALDQLRTARRATIAADKAVTVAAKTKDGE